MGVQYKIYNIVITYYYVIYLILYLYIAHYINSIKKTDHELNNVKINSYVMFINM